MPKTELDSSAQRVSEMVSVLRKREIVRGLTPEKLRLILEDLGPTYVKLGQIMSIRPDVLPQEYCDELVHLQTGAKPLPFEEIKQIIEEEYDCPIEQVFREIGETALGSASIAQVHRGVLRDGTVVAVKVQRPNISGTMAKDIVLLRRAAALMRLVGKDESVIDFDQLLDEFQSIARQEMDFLIEAQNIEEFCRLNAEEPHIAGPKVHRAMTTSRVLVMDFVEGIPFDDEAALEAAGYDMNQLGRRLGEHYVRQMVEDGFFHADPHPGNIRVQGDKIVWLDFGMMGRLSYRDRAAVRKAIIALTQHDAYEMKAAVLTLGQPKARVNHIRLYEDVEALITRYGDMNFAELGMGELTRQILMTLKNNRIAIGPGLSMFARGIITIEGVMRRHCPGVRFVEVFAKGFSLSLEKNIDWREELARIKQDGYHLVRKTMQLPEQISDILRMTMSGQTKVNLELTGSEEPLKRLDGMINKLVFGILGAALLLGSSIISTTQMTPKILEIPLLGVLGYLAALILCGKLLWDIFKNS